MKSTNKDFINYLNHPKGSARELESQIGRAVGAGYISLEDGKKLEGELMIVVDDLWGYSEVEKGAS